MLTPHPPLGSISDIFEFETPRTNILKELPRHIVKLHSNLQTQLNFSWFEYELTLFSTGRRRRKEEEDEEEEPSPSF